MFLTSDPGFYGFDSPTEMMKYASGFSENFKQLALAMRQQAYNIAQSIPGMVSKIVPVALPVLGIVIAVFFAVKFIKKVMR